MTSPWTPRTLVHIDHEYDSDRASNGWSRYGQYVADNEGDFSEDGKPLNPDEFAVAAWRVGTPPVMTQYAVWRPDLRSVTVTRSHETPGDLVVEVATRLPHHALRHPVPPMWQDWERWSYLGEDPTYFGLNQPDAVVHRPVWAVSATLTYLARDWDLVSPTRTSGRGLAQEAQEACALLCAQINQHLGPLVQEALEGGLR